VWHSDWDGEREKPGGSSVRTLRQSVVPMSAGLTVSAIAVSHVSTTNGSVSASTVHLTQATVQGRLAHSRRCRHSGFRNMHVHVALEARSEPLQHRTGAELAVLQAQLLAFGSIPIRRHTNIDSQQRRHCLRLACQQRESVHGSECLTTVNPTQPR
jgi:hypothetical protein